MHQRIDSDACTSKSYISRFCASAPGASSETFELPAGADVARRPRRRRRGSSADRRRSCRACAPPSTDDFADDAIRWRTATSWRCCRPSRAAAGRARSRSAPSRSSSTRRSRRVSGPDRGGVVTFTGVVRRRGHHLSDVVRLEYEAYVEMAETGARGDRRGDRARVAGHSGRHPSSRRVAARSARSPSRSRRRQPTGRRRSTPAARPSIA